MDEVPTPVLVVGGGLVGLSTAGFLASHGIRPLLVERRSGPIPHPRARAINPRSVELFRGLGLEREILAGCSYADSPDALLIRADTLTATPRFQRRLSGRPPRVDSDVTPCPWAPIAQDRLERIVARRAAALGARIRYDTRLVDFEELANGIRCLVRDESSGREQVVRARYLVAADGNRSAIRDRLGIARRGPGTLGHTATFVFRADLNVPLGGRRLGVAHLDRPEPGTVLLPHDGAETWVLSIPHHPGRESPHPGRESPPTAPDRGRWLSAVHAAVGDPDLAVTITDQLRPGTKVVTWEIGAQIATSFRRGRTFLAGDSAHVIPPTGALGASLGIQDGHNLAWRLAAVLTAKAGPALLDGYDTERRPVARLTMEQALLQMSRRTGRSMPEIEGVEPVDYDAVVFGYRYRSAAVHPDTSAWAGPPAWPPGDLRAQAGTRAPHVEIVREGRRQSTIDLFGRGMVLLAAARADGWAEAGRAVAGSLGVDLRTYRVGGDLQDAGSDIHARYGLRHDGAVLVRPDGFVGWRSAGAAERPTDVLEDMLCRLLHLPGHPSGGRGRPCG